MMPRRTILIAALFCLFLATGCSNQLINHVGMPKPPTEGPDEYKKGWAAGCETGMTSYSNDYYRTRYRLNVDAEMMKNPIYNKGWHLGNRYCQYYTSSYLRLGYGDGDPAFTGGDFRDKDSWVQNTEWELFKGWKMPWEGGEPIIDVEYTF